MANLITLARLFLLILLLFLAYVEDLGAQIASLLLLLIVFVMDGVDGWVARRRGESSLFGAVFDIAADRIVETTLWVVLAHLGRVPVWVPLIFLSRGILVDAIRAVGAANNETPFNMIKTGLSRFLVSGRFMRGLYGVIKTSAFVWLFLIPVLESIRPAWLDVWQVQFEVLTNVLVLSSVVLCLVRGIPVVVQFLLTESVFHPRVRTRP